MYTWSCVLNVRGAAGTVLQKVGGRRPIKRSNETVCCAVTDVGFVVLVVICAIPSATMGLCLTKNTILPLTILLVSGLLDNATVSPVSAARVLGVINAGFVVFFVIRTAPITMIGFHLIRNMVLLLMILATTLNFPFVDSRNRTRSVVLGVASVGHGHPVVPSGGGRRKRNGVLVTEYRHTVKIKCTQPSRILSVSSYV